MADLTTGQDVDVLSIKTPAGDSVLDDTNDAVRVNVVAGGGTGGTALADESTFTEGATNFTPIGGVLNDTISSDPTEDQAAAARITAKRGLHINLRDASGVELGTSTTALRVGNNNTTSQGTLSGNGNTDITLPHGTSTVSFFLASGISASISVRGSTNGTTFQTLTGRTLGGNIGISGDSIARYAVAGLTTFRIVVSGYSSGSSAYVITTTDSPAFTESMNFGFPKTAADSFAPDDTASMHAIAYTYNGSNYDRRRGVTNATNSTGTGIAAAGILAQFDDTSPTAITENQFGNLRMSSNRNLYGTIRDAAGNERGVNVNSSNQLTTSVDNASGASAVNIQDGGNSITIDGTVTASNTAGDVAHGSSDSGNPVKVGSEARSSLPTVVSSGQRADAISDLWGRLLVGHIDPAMQTHINKNYTTSQTGTDVWDPASGKKIAVTSLCVSSYGTTAGRVILWFGDNADTTFTQDTDQVLWAGSFAPSANSKPGVALSFNTPVFCTTADRELHITTDANISLDITIEGYEW